jgi:hypothetical protein
MVSMPACCWINTDSESALSRAPRASGTAMTSTPRIFNSRERRIGSSEL